MASTRCGSNTRTRYRDVFGRAAWLGSLLALAGAVSADANAQAQPPAPRQLLIGTEALADRPAVGQGVVRAAAIAPDFSVLAGIRDRLLADRSAAFEVVLPTFDQSALTVVVTGTERVGEATALHGTVKGIPWSSATIVERAGIVAGNINALGKVYQIRYRGPDAGHELREIDQSAFRDHDADAQSPRIPPVTAAAATADAPGARKAVAVDDGSLIDVMVAYTAAARAASGGTAAILAEIALGITETNASYANSNVIQRLRLVHTMEVVYTESASMSTDLDRLQDKTDGFMDNVHSARDTSGADAVSLWTESATGGCGVGFFQNTISAFFETHAFNVVRRDCATGNYSFGHELGHNMGLMHDVFVENGTTPFAYAHGYVDVANKFRTVMAYNDACAAAAPPVNCTRVQYFSNPAVNFNGATTGNAATANNRQVLNDSRVIVANFRASVATAGPAITSPNAVQFFAGIPGSFTLTATGTPVPTFASAGALPASVTFNAGTGTLAGTPTVPDIGAYPLTFTAANGNLPNANQNFMLTISATPLCVLDLDGNGALEPLTDGLMLLRALFGLTGDNVTSNAIGQNATRKTWAQISPLIFKPALNLDGNALTEPLTDGLMILRAMFGLTGTAVTSNAIGNLATRSTWPLIRTYVNATCGSNFGP